jgi:type II secretory pathway component PulF
MPLFAYKAKKNATETVSGQIEAQTQDEAIELINRLGLLPITVKESGLDFSVSGKRQSGKIKTKEIFVFSRQLTNLIKSGIPILRALTILMEQTQNSHFQGIISEIHNGIKGGKTFSQCLMNYPEIFSSLYIAMVRAGEEGGNLRDMLWRISEYQKSQEEIHAKVRTAMAYPLLMAIVGMATVFFILTFVMPRLSTLFANTGEKLPFVTEVLMTISVFLAKWWMGVVVVVFFLIFFLGRWRKTQGGRLFLSHFILSIPLFRELALKVELARFCRTLELLLKSGISLIRGIQITVPVLNNELIKKGISRCQKDLESGISLGVSLKQVNLIPSMISNLITVGEESGLLEEALHDIADAYEQETNEAIKTMTTLLEPMMILAVGLIVGFIVIAMLLPIFQMDVLAR